MERAMKNRKESRTTINKSISRKYGLNIKSFGLTTITIILFCFQSYAQLSIANIDEVNGLQTAKHSLDSLQVLIINSTYSDYDSKHNRLLYCTRDTTFSANEFYYNLYDITGDSLISKSYNNITSGLSIQGLKFQQSTGNLYGIYAHSANSSPMNTYSFVKIDPTTGGLTVINTIPTTQYIRNQQSHSFIHEDSLWYTFRTLDSLFTLNLLTGSIVHKVGIPKPKSSINNKEYLSGLSYDDSTGNVYGLYWDSTLQQQQLVTVDLSTGIRNIVGNIPGVSELYLTSQYTINSKTRQLTFQVSTTNDTNRLYTIDLSNAQIMHKPITYDSFRNRNADLFYYLYADRNGELLTISTSSNGLNTSIREVDLSSSISIYPNPFAESTKIRFNEELQDINIAMFSASGVLIDRVNRITNNEITINRGQLKSGIYFIKVTSGQNSTVKRIVIQ